MRSAARQRGLPARHPLSRQRAGDDRSRRGARRQRAHRRGRAVARHARRAAPRGAAHPPGLDGRQRDEGTRAGHAVSHVGDHRAGVRGRRSPSPCCRARASRSSWPASCRRPSRSPRATPTVVERVQAEFRAPYFRLYGTDDVVGVEIGGALKNVIAIAAGVVEGLGLGHNALAGLDHARARGDVASGLRGRRQARDARRVSPASAISC